jgi:mannosyl-oligosaccharide alpha-1,2-mannosidase
LQGGKKEDMYLSMYMKAVKGMEALLLEHTTPSTLLMLVNIDGVGGWKRVMKMDHLACFTPGMLALGALHS